MSNEFCESFPRLRFTDVMEAPLTPQAPSEQSENMTVDADINALRVGQPYFGVQCPGCRHRAVFETAQLMRLAAAPAGTPLGTMLRKFRCSYCGKKGAEGWPLRDHRTAMEWRALARDR